MERTRSPQSEIEQTQEQLELDRLESFKKQRLVELNQEYVSTLAAFNDKPTTEYGENLSLNKEQAVTQSFNFLSRRLSSIPELEFNEMTQAILKLKLARYYQNHDYLDLNSLFDAIIETPKFIRTSKGSLHRLLEIHEEKTLQAIAEIRKRKAEQEDDDGFNPYEALFKTISGKYYLARLLNMPHLEQESEYMNHCIGTSDSYINRMKRGEIEILTLRRHAAPGMHPRTLDDTNQDVPVLTIEYNPKTGVIEQMKKTNDEYLSTTDPFYADVVDALKQLPETTTDANKPRIWSRINASELKSLPAVKDNHLLTDIGEISWIDFTPSSEHIILKLGVIELTAQTPKEVIAKMLKVFDGVDLEPQAVATTVIDINPNTKAYVGKLEPGIFDRLPESVEHFYTSFPEGIIRRQSVEIGGKSEAELRALLEQNGFIVYEFVESMMEHDDFKRSLREPNPKEPDYMKWQLKSREEAKLIRLRVEGLGFPSGATTDQIYARAVELGLELCPPEVGVRLRLQYVNQPMNEHVYVGMKQIIAADGKPDVFYVERDDDGSWLSGALVRPARRWRANAQIVFRLRKKPLPVPSSL